MNNFEQEVSYQLLKLLSARSDLTQRQMAVEMGVSLGKVNYCLSELAKKGFIKINRFTTSRSINFHSEGITSSFQPKATFHSEGIPSSRRLTSIPQE